MFGPFEFSELVVHDTSGPAAVAEWRRKSVLLSSGGMYDQRYIAVFKFGESDVILGYREYRNPRAYERAVGS